MSSPIDKFLHKGFIASIGEPWDFSSKAGDNKITGRITGVYEAETTDGLLLCEVSPFLKNGIKIHQVVGVNRYQSSQTITVEVAKSKGLGMNFVFLLSGRKITVRDLPDILISSEEKGFIIGTLSLK